MAAKTLGASGVLYTDRRDFYIHPNVLKELWTDFTPFTTVMANRGVTTGMKDPQYKLFEHRNPWENQRFYNNNDTTSIPGSDTAAEITVDGAVGIKSTADSSWLGLECEIWDSTETTKKGVVVVTTVKDDTTIEVKNMSSTVITPADNDVFIVIGNASGEGTVARNAYGDELEVVWNQAQIFKMPIEVTGTLYEAALRGATKELARLREQKSAEHKIQKENAFLRGRSSIGITGTFGDAGRTTAGGETLRTTMGLITAIEVHGNSSGDDQNNFTIVEGSYKYSNFVDDMEKVFQYVPEDGMKKTFCGPGAMSYWSKMGMQKKSGWDVNISPMKRDKLGFNFKELETSHGMLQLIPTFAMRGPYNKTMLVVSDENLEIMQYRKPKFQANIKTDDAYDGVKDQYFSDEGIGITLIESHKLFTIK